MGKNVLNLLSPALDCLGGGGDGPTIQQGNPNSATLTWDANSELDLAGYRVYYGTTPGVYIQAKGEGINVGNTTTYQVIDLQVGTQYYFAVTAYDTLGNESDYSDEVSKTIP